MPSLTDAAPATGGGVPVVASIAALEAATTTTLPGSVVLVEAANPSGQSGGGVFFVFKGGSASPDGGLFVEDASGRIWLRVINGGYVAAQWYGAYGDGVNDDTNAIQTAVDSAQTLGFGGVLLGSGRFLLSSALTITGSVSLVGENKDASVLVQSGATYAVQIGSGGANNPRACYVQGIGFEPSNTGASSILVTNGHDITIRDITISGGTYGMVLQGGSGQFQYNIVDFEINSCSQSAILIGDSSGVVQDVYLSRGVIGGCYNGLYFVWVSGCYGEDIDIISSSNDAVVFYPNGPGATVASVFLARILADTAAADGWYFGGSGAITDVTLMNCWGSSNAGQGFNFGSYHVNGVSMTACRADNNQYNGVSLGLPNTDNGKVNVALVGCQIFCNSQSGTGNANGVLVGSGVSGFRISDCDIGLGGSIAYVSGNVNKQAYGINILSGSGNDFMVNNNRLIANVTGGIANGATGGNTTVVSNQTE